MTTRKKKDQPVEELGMDSLIAEKIRLWNEVKYVPDYLNTEQYRRIDEIDKRLWELVKS